MEKFVDYIKRIEIDSLWSGRRHVVWNLDRKVNILSGVNGVGKSTILNKVTKSLANSSDLHSNMLKGVHLTVVPEDATRIRFDMIRSFDRPLLNAEMVSKMNASLATELDWQLFQLQRKYLDYQVNIGNRIIYNKKPKTSASPNAGSKTSWTACSQTRERKLCGVRMKSILSRWARNCSPISCRVERNKYWRSFSPC